MTDYEGAVAEAEESVSLSLCHGVDDNAICMSVPPRVREKLRARSATRIALVGASDAPHKYGNIILRDLQRGGYTVLPISARRATIGGEPAYATVADAPGPIDIINVVIPPDDALQVVRALDADRCDVVWFQPGAFDERVVEAARQKFQHVIAGDCIMVVHRQL